MARCAAALASQVFAHFGPLGPQFEPQLAVFVVCFRLLLNAGAGQFEAQAGHAGDLRGDLQKQKQSDMSVHFALCLRTCSHDAFQAHVPCVRRSRRTMARTRRRSCTCRLVCAALQAIFIVPLIAQDALVADYPFGRTIDLESDLLDALGWVQERTADQVSTSRQS